MPFIKIQDNIKSFNPYSTGQRCNEAYLHAPKKVKELFEQAVPGFNSALTCQKELTMHTTFDTENRAKVVKKDIFQCLCSTSQSNQIVTLSLVSVAGAPSYGIYSSNPDLKSFFNCSQQELPESGRDWTCGGSGILTRGGRGLLGHLIPLKFNPEKDHPLYQKALEMLSKNPSAPSVPVKVPTIKTTQPPTPQPHTPSPTPQQTTQQPGTQSSTPQGANDPQGYSHLTIGLGIAVAAFCAFKAIQKIRKVFQEMNKKTATDRLPNQIISPNKASRK